MDENKSGTKIKSLRGGSVDVNVPHRVKWPQEYVLSGTKKERVQYDNLSVTQWVAGFCRIMKEESNVENKEHMLDYLIQLLEDANDFFVGCQRPAMLSYFVGWNGGCTKLYASRQNKQN